MCALFESAAEADRRGGVGGIRAFLAELAGQQIPADRERESRLRGRGVQVLTAHRARGREWDLVVVAGVQEGVWPVGRRVSTVLEAAALTTDGLTGRTDHRDLLAAERRLFHLACSRARRRLVVTAAAGTEGEADSPSRFLAELGRAAVGARPAPAAAHPRRARRRAAAPRHCARPPRPNCVLPLPSSSPGWPTPSTTAAVHLVPAADPSTWWGVRELTSRPEPLASGRSVRLSPSQVTGILTCPRRYFLAREARGEGEPGLAAALGSLIHLLVQQAVNEGWGLAELRARLDQVWHRLRFEAAWLSATERVEVELGLARFLAWREANAAELVGVEVPFTLRARGRRPHGAARRQGGLAGAHVRGPAGGRLQDLPDGADARRRSPAWNSSASTSWPSRPAVSPGSSRTPAPPAPRRSTCACPDAPRTCRRSSTRPRWPPRRTCTPIRTRSGTPPGCTSGSRWPQGWWRKAATRRRRGRTAARARSPTAARPPGRGGQVLR